MTTRHLREAVLEIRSFRSEVIGNGGIARELVEPLQLMRRYCVQFLDRVGANEDPWDAAAAGRHLFTEHRWYMHDYWFGEALGELRSGVGMQLAVIAASFGLNIEDDLARTLPQPESAP